MSQNAPREIVLAVIPSSDSASRMVFATRCGNASKPIILRQESFSPNVGWFTQNTIEMTRQEMVLLRSAMGGSAPQACARTSRRIQADPVAHGTLKLAELPAAS